MHRTDARVRVLTVGIAAMLVVGACSSSTTSSTAPGSAAPASAAPGDTAAPASQAPEGPKAGGTITILTQNDQFNRIDPQRAYTGEDMAFFSGTIYRSLTQYIFSADPVEGTSLTPDLATDLGTATDGGKTWSFTLRDGVSFQDGSPITCEDIKYGVSRTFATDIISEGPTYAIQYLDIPTLEDGSSAYKGPYTGEGQELFDKSIDCSPDGKTITFHLNGPHADFNYTVTLGFSPVPKAKDTGESYGGAAPWPVSSGPYQIESYTTGNGGKMILVRNPNWKPESDPYRKAYPDRWEVHFGIDAKVLDQRLMASAGNDAYAIQYGDIQPENLGVIFVDEQTTTPEYEGRAVSGFDPYSLYYWINVNKIPNVKHRQAMAVALDRAAIRLNTGGAFAGTYADGVIKPNIGQDYAPTGYWESFYGQPVPETGDPELAKKLIAESGEPMPEITFNHSDTPVAQKNAAIVIDSLGKAGIKVKSGMIEAGQYYSVVFDPEKAGDFGTNGWGADWPNASTVIPPIFTQKGGWDVSQVDDPAFNAAVDAANSELDRAKQAKMWQDLNKQAIENAWVIPTLFTLSQTLAGTGVGETYRWAAYGSWPYGAMYVKQ